MTTYKRMNIRLLLLCQILISFCNSNDLNYNETFLSHSIENDQQSIKGNKTIIVHNPQENNGTDFICKMLEKLDYNILQSSNNNSIISIEGSLLTVEALKSCASFINESRFRDLTQLLKLDTDVPFCCSNIIKNEKFACTNQSYVVETLSSTYLSISNKYSSLLDNCSTTISSRVISESAVVDGSLTYKDESEYCLFRDNNSLVLFSCLPSNKEICRRDCYRKCCNIGHLFSYSENKCVPSVSAKIWLPNSGYISSSRIWNGSYYYEFGFPKCSRFFAVSAGSEENLEFNFMKNSSLHVYKYNRSYDAPQYCVDMFHKNGLLVQEALICFPEIIPESNNEKCDYIHANIYPSFLIVSCVFLLLTIFVYLIIPELHLKVNGKCVIANTATLMFSYVCLISNEYARPIPITMCPILGLFMQYFTLSSFFWINVMCFDVWCSLRSYRYIGATSGRKRFCKYCIYAYGLPLVITIVTACIHYMPKQSTIQYLVSPGFGVTACFFNMKDPRAWWAYFYGFILAIMVSNLFFFLHLLFMLQKDRTSTDMALDRRKQKHVVWLKLYLKLFFLMGVTWIFEVVSWIDGNCKIWIWSDSINALRGVFIFIIFVCKRSIWIKIVKNNSFLSSLRSSSSTKMSKKSSSRSRFYVDIKIDTPT